MNIGYARISTEEQNPELQVDALKQADCERIFTDNVSGSKTERPELTKALENLREGDTLIVWRLDRLGRNLKHLIELVNDFEDKGIGFKSLTEAIDTTTSGGKLIFHIFGAIAEFERNLIRERTYAGLQAARARGRTGGRKPKLNPKQQSHLLKLYDEKKLSIKEICEIMKISKATLYAYINAAKK